MRRLYSYEFFFRASTPAFAEGVDLAEGMTLVGSGPRQIVAIRTMIPVGLAGWLVGWLLATPTPNTEDLSVDSTKASRNARYTVCRTTWTLNSSWPA